MRPKSFIDTNLVKKCELETEKLFQLFLDIPKFQAKETNEVQYQVRERRTDSFGSSNSLSGSTSNISTRGVEDASKYKDIIEAKQKRQSREYGTPPMYGSSPMLNTLESDSVRAPSFDAAVLRDVKPRPRSSEVTRQRPPSYQSYESQRPRSNTGPTEEMLSEAARTIANIGDNIEEEYRDRMSVLKSELVEYLEKNTAVTYEVFAAHVNSLVGEDRNWTNFLFIMQLGKRVIDTASQLSTRTYFARFLGNAFGEEIARTGNSADQYVRNHASERPTNI